jgi:hypothetical protein
VSAGLLLLAGVEAWVCIEGRRAPYCCRGENREEDSWGNGGQGEARSHGDVVGEGAGLREKGWDSKGAEEVGSHGRAEVPCA